MLVDETRGHEKDGQTVASLSYTTHGGKQRRCKEKDKH